MGKIWDWIWIVLAAVIIIGVLITGNATVTAVVCGWLCAILEKITNMINRKNEYN